NDDVADLDFRERLAVPDSPLVLLLALELEDQNFLAAPAIDDGPFHGRFTQVRTGHHLAFILDDRAQAQGYFRAGLARQFFHADHIPRGHPVLFPAGFDNGLHHTLV